MTKKQLMKKADIARRTGEALLEDGVKLVFHASGLYSIYFSLVAADGNVIDTSANPESFDYICD